MSFEISIRPIDLRDYAKSHGWSLQPHGQADRLYVMTNPAYARRQLVFPMDVTAPDYAEAIGLAVAKLAALENRPSDAIFKNLVEATDDSIAFRVVTPRYEDTYIPLSFAGSLVQGVEQLLLASASTVLKPQTHHPRMSRAEAQELLSVARFRHTQVGSFVINVSCPVQALDVQTALLWDEPETPFVRRAIVTLERSLQALLIAIETDTLGTLIDGLKVTNRPLISSNFCEALLRFGDDKLNNLLNVTISWASGIPRPMDYGGISSLTFQPDYFPRIEEVRRELRAHERHIEDVFVGTVEGLEGEMGENSLRAGEVILSLFSSDGEQVRARAQLDEIQYAVAAAAHMTDGAFVVVEGRLHPGRQPRVLSDLRAFRRLLQPTLVDDSPSDALSM